MPHVVTSLTRLINDPESTMKDFEDVIKMDPILVSRLLRLVNSPFYGLAQTVDSIGRAVAFLGMKNLHNLVVTDALKAIFVAPGNNPTFSRKRLWLHSGAVAICNKMVAERIFGINGDDAFLCGILHDFGLLVEEQIERDTFNELCGSASSSSRLIEAENSAFGTNHSEICYQMTLDWAMPSTIQEAILHHHTIADDIEPQSMTGIIQISEYIVSQLEHTTLPGLTTEVSPQLMAHMEENIDEYTILIEDLPEELEKAEAIYN